jgi:hypothetical protein
MVYIYIYILMNEFGSKKIKKMNLKQEIYIVLFLYPYLNTTRIRRANTNNYT